MTTKDFAKELGVTIVTVRRWVSSGIVNPDKDAKGHLLFTDEHVEAIRKYKTRNIRYCSICSKQLSRHTKNQLCFGCENSQRADLKARERFDHWLSTGDLGIAVGSTLVGRLRILLLEHYGNCCKICGLSPTWQGKPLVLILDHIDGDASNNKENNLRFVCPNCDSQLDTYKSKNKNSARRHRKNY